MRPAWSGVDTHGIESLTTQEVLMLRRAIVAISLVLAFSVGALIAQTPNQNQERHPVLHRAIEQINNMKMRLEKAPQDFGGHKHKAIEALGVAANELEQAIQFDKK
jgi:hypothetical protein